MNKFKTFLIFLFFVSSWFVSFSLFAEEVITTFRANTGAEGFTQKVKQDGEKPQETNDLYLGLGGGVQHDRRWLTMDVDEDLSINGNTSVKGSGENIEIYDQLNMTSESGLNKTKLGLSAGGRWFRGDFGRSIWDSVVSKDKGLKYDRRMGGTLSLSRELTDRSHVEGGISVMRYSQDEPVMTYMARAGFGYALTSRLASVLSANYTKQKASSYDIDIYGPSLFNAYLLTQNTTIEQNVGYSLAREDNQITGKYWTFGLALNQESSPMDFFRVSWQRDFITRTYNTELAFGDLYQGTYRRTLFRNHFLETGILYSERNNDWMGAGSNEFNWGGNISYVVDFGRPLIIRQRLSSRLSAGYRIEGIALEGLHASRQVVIASYERLL